MSDRQFRAITYNPQAITASRPLAAILSALTFSVLGLQSTGIQSRRPPQTAEYFYERNGKYDILHFPRPRASANHTLGCALALDRSTVPLKYVTCISTVPANCFGRGGMIRLRKRGNFDLSLFITYFPLTDHCNASDNRVIFTDLLSWVETVLDQLPLRTLPIILADCNAHIAGPVFNRSGDPLVAHTMHAHDNWAGTQLRQFLIRNNLALLNTFGTAANQPTWYGPVSTSQVDFIIAPASYVPQTASFALKKQGFILQLGKGRRNYDHVPILARFPYHDFHIDCSASQFFNCCKSENIDALKSSPQRLEAFQQTLSDFVSTDEYRIHSTHAAHCGDSDTLLGGLQDALCHTLATHHALGRPLQQWLTPADAEKWKQIVALRKHIFHLRPRRLTTLTSILQQWRLLILSEHWKKEATALRRNTVPVLQCNLDDLMILSFLHTSNAVYVLLLFQTFIYTMHMSSDIFNICAQK